MRMLEREVMCERVFKVNVEDFWVLYDTQDRK